MSSPTFKIKLLDNVASGISHTWYTTSSSMVFTVSGGSALLTDESDGAGIPIWNGDSATDAHIILDFYQGAELKVTATAAGTTVTVAKHSWQDT